MILSGSKYPENLHNLHDDLPILPEKMKNEKVEKLIENLHDKKRICDTHKKFKASTKSWISITKVHRVIKFN